MLIRTGTSCDIAGSASSHPSRYSFRQWNTWAIEIFEAGIDDVLSYLHYPQPHRARISSTNPLERLNLEIRRPTRVVGIFPNPAACLRLIGMLLVEKNDDWLTDDKAYLTFDDALLEESAAKVVSMAASQ